LDDETRVGLWNVTYSLVEIFEGPAYQFSPVEGNLTRRLWTHALNRPGDEFRGPSAVWTRIKRVILEGTWLQALEIIEDTVAQLEHAGNAQSLQRSLADAFDTVFDHFLVGYRFVGSELTPISSSEEAKSVAVAIDESAVVSGARHSLLRAVELFSDRSSPDYANSVKESISAVEAVVRRVTAESTLGAGLNRLETAGVRLHPALKAAWSKLYGWSSDEDGIRHGAVDPADVDQALAKYTLVSCSAFVSYLIEAGHKAGLL